MSITTIKQAYNEFGELRDRMDKLFIAANSFRKDLDDFGKTIGENSTYKEFKFISGLYEDWLDIWSLRKPEQSGVENG